MNRNDKRFKYYTKEEKNCLSRHIVKCFGQPTQFLKETGTELDVNIHIIPPSEEAPYYTLITLGMGGHIMNMPPKLGSQDLSRSELIMMLPKDWEISSADLIWHWPFRWLKVLAKLPMEEASWLGYGSSVGNEEAFAENTKLSAFILAQPSSPESDAPRCILPNGEVINFYQLVPIYNEELNLQSEKGADDLFQKFGEDFSVITDIKRKNYCI